MKKLITLLVIAVLAMSAVAFADTYSANALTFEYSKDYFTISMEDHTGDEDLIILSDKYDGFVHMHYGVLKDGESFPTAEEVEKNMNVKVEKMDDWANFKDVLTYDISAEDGQKESVFIAPVYNKDKVEGILTVRISAGKVEGEEKAIENSDKISEVVDTLVVKEK